MRLIERLEMNNEPFLFSHRFETAETDWDMFHSHQGLELLLVLEGEGQVLMERKLYPLHAGRLIVFQPYQLHRVQMRASNVTYVRSVVVYDPAVVDTYLQPFPLLRHWARWLWKGRLPKQVFTLEGTTLDAFVLLYDRAKPMIYQTAGAEKLEHFLLFLLALLPLIRSACLPLPLPGGTEEESARRAIRHAESIMEWIERHYREPFDLGRLADELHLSPHHVSHLFREDTGLSVTDYLTARRMKEACLLLGSTDLPVQAVARAIGLSNDSYFTQLFKRKLGVTPREYRNQATNSRGTVHQP